MTKIAVIAAILLLQETIFITFFFALIDLPVIQYNDIEHVFEENSPPILIFANT